MNLYIFNPETDYAVADDRRQYTPPKRVAELRRQFAALPAIWAEKGDKVLVPELSEEMPYLDLARSKSVDLTTDIGEAIHAERVVPWGWNRALVHTLRKVGVGDLLTDEQLDRWRELAHRRNTIYFHPDEEGPWECRYVAQVMAILAGHSDCYLKAPWSSSGRGVVRTLRMKREDVERWADGIIRRQGSVMVERAWNRTLDFATEWECGAGKVAYKGLSVFVTSREGRYLGNLCDSEENLMQYIRKFTDFPESIIERQAEILSQHFAPSYEGPLGIDMLADSKQINICVEVNLRHTMGMAAAQMYKRNGYVGLWQPFGNLKKD